MMLIAIQAGKSELHLDTISQKQYSLKTETEVKQQMQINWNKIVHSRTLWANGIAVVAIALHAGTTANLSAEQQLSILVVLNIFLRIITHEGFYETTV